MYLCHNDILQALKINQSEYVICPNLLLLLGKILLNKGLNFC